jgi:hypothetical protein
MERGTEEAINVYSYLLWVAVLAMNLCRRNRGQDPSPSRTFNEIGTQDDLPIVRNIRREKMK